MSRDPSQGNNKLFLQPPGLLLPPASAGSLSRGVPNSEDEFVNQIMKGAGARSALTLAEQLELDAKSKNLDLVHAIQSAKIEVAIDCVFFGLKKKEAEQKITERVIQIIRTEPAACCMKLVAFLQEIESKYPQVNAYIDEQGKIAIEAVPLHIQFKRDHSDPDPSALIDLISESATLGRLDPLYERKPDIIKLVDDVSTDISSLILASVPKELYGTKPVFKTLALVGVMLLEARYRHCESENQTEGTGEMHLKYLVSNLLWSSVFSASVDKVLKGLPDSYSKKELLSNLINLSDFDPSEHKALVREVPSFKEVFQYFSTRLISFSCSRAVELQNAVSGLSKLSHELPNALNYIQNFVSNSPNTFGPATSTYDGEFIVFYPREGKKPLAVGVNTIEKTTWVTYGNGDLSRPLDARYVPAGVLREVRLTNSSTIFFDEFNEPMIGPMHRLQPSQNVPIGDMEKSQALEIIGTTREHIARLADRFPEVFRSGRWIRPAILILSENSAKIVVEQSVLTSLPQSGIELAKTTTAIPECLYCPRNVRFFAYEFSPITSDPLRIVKPAEISIENHLDDHAKTPMGLIELLPGCILSLKFIGLETGIYFVKKEGNREASYIKSVKLNSEMLTQPLSPAQLKIVLSELSIADDVLVHAHAQRSNQLARQGLVFTSDFHRWSTSLPPNLENLVHSRLQRFKQGNVGDCDCVASNGLNEAIIDSGPGLRIYFATNKRQNYHLLLWGGYKRTQLTDIPKATALYQFARDSMASAWQ